MRAQRVSLGASAGQAVRTTTIYSKNYITLMHLVVLTGCHNRKERMKGEVKGKRLASDDLVPTDRYKLQPRLNFEWIARYRCHTMPCFPACRCCHEGFRQHPPTGQRRDDRLQNWRRKCSKIQRLEESTPGPWQVRDMGRHHTRLAVLLLLCLPWRALTFPWSAAVVRVHRWAHQRAA